MLSELNLIFIYILLHLFESLFCNSIIYSILFHVSLYFLISPTVYFHRQELLSDIYSRYYLQYINLFHWNQNKKALQHLIFYIQCTKWEYLLNVFASTFMFFDHVVKTITRTIFHINFFKFIIPCHFTLFMQCGNMVFCFDWCLTQSQHIIMIFSNNMVTNKKLCKI